ncbi:MAG: divalent-cation tolerance protein CutA [Planctomycetes bacterium]|nr:divalent-cation tolerance protein CutA [Planctomycetota bacterium]
MSNYITVSTTLPSREDARRLSAELVERRLVACAQMIGPIDSAYRWEGKLETAQEWLLMLKTRCDAYPAVEQAIRERHPYDTPQITAHDITAGYAAYLAWIDAEVT